MGLFKKTSWSDHGDTITAITDDTTCFVSILSGSDANPGTRALPKGTIAAATTKSIILIKGSTTENIVNDRTYIGDNEVSVGNYSGGNNNNGRCLSCTIQNGSSGGMNTQTYKNVVIKGTLTGTAGGSLHMNNCFVNICNLSVYGGTTNYIHKNNTILALNNYVSNVLASTGNNVLRNCIIINSIDLYNFVSLNVLYYPIFQNCLFRKATVWKWNGTTIIDGNSIKWGTYGNEAGDWLADLISAMKAYGEAMSAGAAKTYFQAMFPASGVSNILFNCKLVDDGVTGIPIFNRYDTNYLPIDYTLKLDSNNVAITMSDTMSYVGCYQASAKTNDLDNNVLEFTNPVNVDSNGNDTTGTPKLLVSPGAGKFQIGVEATEQTRNRCTSSNVVKFERGFTLVGFQSQMKSGLGSRFSFGKCQLYNTTTTPCLPMESLEVIPYDTIDHASSEVGYSQFPRFSAMFNDRCQMWFKTANNQPLLFSDLAAFGITVTQEISLTPAFLSEYGSWAVTNADMASYHLSTKTGCALRNIPLYFAKIQLNLNYYN